MILGMEACSLGLWLTCLFRTMGRISPAFTEKARQGVSLGRFLAARPSFRASVSMVHLDQVTFKYTIF